MLDTCAEAGRRSFMASENLIFRKMVVMKKLIKEGDDFVACDLVNLEKAINFPF